jgi:murein DD-endopeptidase MepM/ murein hydrolase activator NlpD
VEVLKNNLVEKENELDQKKKDLKDQKNQLVNTQESYQEEKLLKSTLLAETKSSEKRYQNLLAELKQEQEEVENETAILEKRMREKLAKQENALSKLGEVHLIWPVGPDRGLSATFHDPDYPFRYIFEHPGIDIRAYQGTEIKAAETGYVGTAKNAGMGYSYILLVHNEGASTVYGHVSRIDVAEGDYVTKGQVIGLSGGMPGTRGAGRLTTGPHLHFEVRYNGIPVNPLNYLP